MVAAALPAFREAAGTSWPSPPPEILRIHQAIAYGDLAAARQLATAGTTSHPESDEAAFTHGIVLYLSAAFGSARPLFERVLRNGPSFAGSDRVFYFYGICLNRLGEGQLAREAFDAQLALAPTDGDTHAALAELTLQEGDPGAALILFRRAMTLLESEQQAGLPTGPARAKVLAGIGNAHLQQDQVEQALEALKTSVALDPSQPQPYYALSRVHLRLGDPVAAREAIDHFGRLSAGR